MYRALPILFALFLAGCTSPEAEAQAKAEAEARDDAICQNRGFKPNTLNYDDCRALLDQQRAQVDRAALAGRLQGRLPQQLPQQHRPSHKSSSNPRLRSTQFSW